MPLLPHARKLRGGLFWTAQSKFDGEWKQYNTHCQSKKIANEVVKMVEAYCHKWDIAKPFLLQFKGESDEVIKGMLEWTREEIAAGNNPFGGNKWVGLKSTIEEYLAECKKELATGTVEMYKYDLGLLYKCLKDADILKIGKSEVKKFIEFAQSERTKKVSPATVNITLRNVTTFLNWSKREKEILKDWKVPDIPKLQEPPKKLPDYYTPAQCTALVRSAKQLSINDSNFGHYVAFLLLTGLRKTEAIRMEWTDIDYTTRIMIVNNRKARRIDTIPLMPAVETLLKIIGTKKKGQIFNISPYSGYLDEKWNEAVETAGITRFKLHNCRDSCAVNFLLEGVPLTIVKRLLRHSSIQTTVENYVEFSAEDISLALQGTKQRQKKGTYVAAILRGITK